MSANPTHPPPPYTLSPELAGFVARTNELAACDGDLAARRAAYRRMCLAFTPARPAGVVATNLTLSIDGSAVPVRSYRPQGKAPLTGWPCLLYFHGGGWAFGDLDSHDFITAALTATLRAAVIAVDYRLAPEHPFPAAFDDSLTAWRAVQAEHAALGVDPRRVAVAGDSAGGNLAAALCLALRNISQPAPCGQALIYPVLEACRAWDVESENRPQRGQFLPDLQAHSPATGQKDGEKWTAAADLQPTLPKPDRLAGEPTRPSYREHADAPLLSARDIADFCDLYLPDIASRHDPRAAPLAADRFDRLPPAFVAVAEFDPLRDDGVEYARRLHQTGVAVEFHLGVGLVHGCLRARGLSPAVDCLYDALAAALGRFFTLSP